MGWGEEEKGEEKEKGVRRRGESGIRSRAAPACAGGLQGGGGGPSSPRGAPYGNDPAFLAVPLARSLTESRKRGRGKRKKKKRQRGGGELGDDEEESPGARELPGPGRGGGAALPAHLGNGGRRGGKREGTVALGC